MTCRIRRVGGLAADAVIAVGSDIVPHDLAANHHRVGGIAANPTCHKKSRLGIAEAGFF